MDLNFTEAEQAFREEVRAFLRRSVPAETRRKVLEGLHLSKEDNVGWHRLLAARGWGAPNWPNEFGGTGWDPVRQYRCQGYSEPGSGSDLASLKTSAVRQGDHYVVNGQKTWITLAQHADWIFCLVRTDPAAKAQEGISFLLIDMKTKGIAVRPIVTMDGGAEINEVWFEDVNVPVENVVGKENKGWTYAKFLLGHERTNIAGVGISKRQLRRLKRIAASESRNGRPLAEDPLFAARIAQVEIELMALEITNLRVISADAARKAPGPEASLLKIKGTEIQQALSELMMQAVGPYAIPFQKEDGALVGPAYAAPLGPTYCNLRKTSIYGGSNEIQKNIVSQWILRL